MGLRDLEGIKVAYDSGFDNILEDFYIPVLMQTKKYSRIAGFFSSSSLAVASRGISGLVKNGGTMEMIVSPRLSSEDIEMMEKVNSNPEKVITDIMLTDLDEFESTLEKRRVDALGWLMAKGLLKIKIATVYDNKGRLMDSEKIEESGLFHIKVGILEDENGDILTFSGSINETASAWVRNVEEFKVFKSWEYGQSESAKVDIDKFEAYWNGETKRVKISDLPIAVKNKIIEKLPEDFSEIEDEILREENIEEKGYKLNFSPFEYQIEALEVWKKNHRAIFEMATGTGKTKTAEICISTFLKESESPAVVFIICPQDTLAKQWLEDIKDSGMESDNYIICDSDSKGWDDKKGGVNSLAYKLLEINVERAGKKNYLFVYSTFDTYCSDKFINMVRSNKLNSKYFVIGDEVHGLGSQQRSRGLIEEYDYRLGLSATPDRWYDDYGTKRIRDYFGEDTYVFTIKEALNKINPLTGKTYLTPYEYIPKFVKLEPDELEKYKSYTERIIKKSVIASDDTEAEQQLEQLIFMRADIHKSAVNKICEFEKVLDDIGDDINDTIVFTSPSQIDEVEKILRKRGVFAKRFTKDQGKKPVKEYGNLSEREHIIQMFKDGDCKVLIAIKCLDEGIDIPSAKRAIILSSSTNPREYVQRIGRVIRRSKGKEKAIIYDFIVEPDYSMMSPELQQYEKKIFSKEMVRIQEISENALNRLDIINLVYSKLL